MKEAKLTKAGRPRLPTRSKLFSLRLHPDVRAALDAEADKLAKIGPRPALTSIISFAVKDWLRGRGHRIVT